MRLEPTVLVSVPAWTVVVRLAVSIFRAATFAAFCTWKAEFELVIVWKLACPVSDNLNSGTANESKLDALLTLANISNWVLLEKVDDGILDGQVPNENPVLMSRSWLAVPASVYRLLVVVEVVLLATQSQ